MGLNKRKTPSNHEASSSSSSFSKKRKRVTTDEVKSRYFSPPNYSYFPKAGERSLHWNFKLTLNKRELLMKEVFKTRLNHYSIRGIIDDVKKYYLELNHRQPKEWDLILNKNKENYSPENYEIFENQSIKDHDFLMSNIKLLYHLLYNNQNFYWKYLFKPTDPFYTWNDINNNIYGRWLRTKLGLKEMKELSQEYLVWNLFEHECHKYFNTDKSEWPLWLAVETKYYEGLQKLLDFILKFNLDDEEGYEIFEKRIVMMIVVIVIMIYYQIINKLIKIYL